MSDKCKKCSGSGEAFGGVCFSCNGSGSVSEVRYQTVSHDKSSHPAFRHERDYPQVDPIPATPEIAERSIQEAKELVQFEIEEKKRKEGKCQHTCEHVFNIGNCTLCGIFEVQFLYSQTVAPKADVHTGERR